MEKTVPSAATLALRKQKRLRRVRDNVELYSLILPVLVHIFIFCYIPMYGILIAFQNYTPGAPILAFDGSVKWVGLKHFKSFVTSPMFPRLFYNTFHLSFLCLVFGFLCPILFALLVNELKDNFYKKFVQTTSYMPYFISNVVICGMIKSFMSYDGVFNQITAMFGMAPKSFLSDPALFPSVIVFSDLWQCIGWNSIIYMAALAGIDPDLYEAAHIDGCGRLRQMWHITLPGIVPTIITLLILSIGGLLGANSGKILLLYSPLTYETGDVIGTFIYRRGLQGGDFSYSTAVGLFQTVINFLLLIFANWFSNKTTETSLW